MNGLLLILVSTGSLSCSSEKIGYYDFRCNPESLTEVKVAAILPLQNGQDEYWRECLEMCSDNLTKAFCCQGEGVRLKFEWYDEFSPNLTTVVDSLASSRDIVAVIGGLHSSFSLQMAAAFCRTDMPFFTLGTTEQLIRGYSSWGNLWAMTETDITQSEVQLAKAIQSGAHSIALLAKENDPYGQSFLDWIPFQAREMGVENRGTFAYSETESYQIEDCTRQALTCGADYLICTPSNTEELGRILKVAASVPHTTRILTGEAAYDGDAISTLGTLVEGLEGVCYGADPESGFNIAYEFRFGHQPILGEAQAYDAAMLIAFASYLKLFFQIDFKEAMRRIVDGKEYYDGTWRWEDMGLAVSMLAKGQYPDLRGASGDLDFDSKVYTNVLHTVYCNYIIYNGKYVFLDYLSTDGSRRSDPTMAAWNWKKTNMREFGDSGKVVVYPELDAKWALLVASSSGWTNYRHQADVLRIYQILKSNGYDDSHIVLVMADDIAENSKNVFPGTIYSRMDGENVYTDVHVDYHPNDLKPADLKDILMGNRSERLPEVISADSDDNIFVFWSGHGFKQMMDWPTFPYKISVNDVESCMTVLEASGQYRKVIGFIETCYSGSVFNVADKHNGMLFFTAADTDETSKADEYNYYLDVWMSNRFTATLQDCMINSPQMSFRDLYYRLFQSTIGSHVCAFGTENYGNLYDSGLSEILSL